MIPTWLMARPRKAPDPLPELIELLEGTGSSLYDPTNLETVWQDDAGTIPALPGDPVGRIDDLLSTGNNATQTSEDARPTLSASSLVFDGTDDYLQITEGLYDAGGGVLVISTSAGAQEGRRLFSEGNSGASGPFYTLINGRVLAPTSMCSQIRDDTNTQQVEEVEDNAPDAFTGEWKTLTVWDTGTEIRRRVEGGPWYTTEYERSPVVTLNQAALGCLFRDTISQFFQGSMHKIVKAHGTSFVDADIELMEAWVKEGI